MSEDRDRTAERQLSDETRMRLAIAEIEERLFKLPVHVAFGALATLGGRLVVASHKDEDKRRNNRHQFMHTVDTVIRLEEQKQDNEARVRRAVDARAAYQQRLDPLANVNRKAIELDVRADLRAAEEKKPGNA